MVHFIPPTQRRLAMLAAQADSAPVLICGSSGTGKGAIARWIHSSGARAAGPFVVADPKRRLGEQFAAAQGGTLLVPEVGEWPLGEQKVLLQYLKSKSIAQEGGLRLLANIRVMTTTSQALEGRARGGLFNGELLERLNVFRIEMPPLNERADEFVDIVLGILAEITRDLHKEHLRAGSPEVLSPEAWQSLNTYSWPGNLRELRNVLRLAVAAAQRDRIEAGDLPEFGAERADLRTTREQFEKIYRLYRAELDGTSDLPPRR